MVVLPWAIKSLPEDKLKNFALMSLAEEIVRHPTIDCVVWLLVATLMQIYNEKEEAGQTEMQNGQFEERPEAECIVQGDKSLKKSLILNGIRKIVISEQDLTQPSFGLVERN